MGLRVLLTLGITFFGIFAAFNQAFYGLLTYAYWSYANPEEATWGLLPLDRLSYVVGLVVVLTTFLQEKKLFTANYKNYLIILFWSLCFFSALGYWEHGQTQWQFRFFTRVILITLIISVLVDNKKKIHYYFWAIALFVGLIAAQAGVKGTLAGQVGDHRNGYVGVIRGGRAFTAVWLCTVIPIAFYMMMAEKRRSLKFLLAFIFFGDILALILTYSRAGFIGLVCVFIFMLLLAKRKLMGCLMGALLMFILLGYFIPEEYIYRIETTKNYDVDGEEVDGSAAGRLIAWGSAMEMIRDKPWSGVGFYRSEAQMGNYPDPKTGMAVPGKAIHNSFLKVAAELGLPALLLYLFFFGLIYLTLMRIKRKVRVYGLDQDYHHYATMLQVAFVGFFSSGFFVNASFVDLVWHLAGLTIALEQIVNNDTKTTTAFAESETHLVAQT